MEFLLGLPYNGSVQNTGGLQVLKKLTDVLTDLGETVYVIGSAFHNGKTKQIRNVSEIDLNKVVVIYPETIVGNPLLGKKVVRWILYHTTEPNPPIHISAPDFKTFLNLKKGIEYTWENKDEYFYYFDYYKTLKKRDKKILRVHNFRLNEFENFGLERDGYCHLFHKNNIDQSFVNEFNSDHIPIGKWDEIVKMFNRKKYFLTYDDSTYFLNIAALCGCIPVILYKEKKENFIENNPMFKYGIAYGFEGIEHAENTINLMKNHLLDIEEKSIDTVREFINYCNKKFKK